MTTILSTIAPVFLVILVGFGFARVGLMSRTAESGIMEFVLRVGIPALLFRTMVDARPPGGETLRLWATYFAAVGLLWAVSTVVTRYALGRPNPDQPMVAMTSIFGNVVLLGIPIGLAVYGPEAGTPIAVLTSIHSIVLWLAATLHAEAVSEHGTTSLHGLVRDLARNLLTNPIIMSILTGLLWRQTGIGLDGPVRGVFDLLAQAGVPCALFALGLSLRDLSLKGQAPTLAAMLTIKLAIMPLLVWWLTFHVAGLDPVWAGTATVFAACPPGVNAFVLARQYGRVLNSTSGAIALGTALSVATMTAILFLISPP
ncbi:MAG: AEC family transporter [Dichotomicrobium sp.]